MFYLALVFELHLAFVAMKNSMFRDIRIAPLLQSHQLMKSDALNTALFWNSCFPCCCNVDTFVWCYPCFRPCVPGEAVGFVDTVMPVAKSVIGAFKAYNHRHADKPISLETIARKLQYASSAQNVADIFKDVITVSKDDPAISKQVVTELLMMWQAFDPATRAGLLQQVQGMLAAV